MKQEKGSDLFMAKKKTPKLKEKSGKKISDSILYDGKFEELIGKKKIFKQKSEREFKTNQRNFEYDYEEDFYEPIY